MNSNDTRKIFKLLGGTRSIRFVGGCVRNMMLGEPTGDIDLATIHPPDEVIRILSSAHIKTVPTGIDHGTVTAVVNGVGYEITTLRRDVATDGRRAVVSFTTDWAEDAARRDFTINALYAGLDGTLYDPLGTGMADLEHRKVRFVGKAEMRIQEDYLRILRFFRFHSLYGRGSPDKAGLMACIKFSQHIKHLSRERVTGEIKKILASPTPHKILSVMQKYRIIPDMPDNRFQTKDLQRLVGFQKDILLTEDQIFVTRLWVASGFSLNPDGIFRLSKRQAELINCLAAINADFNAGHIQLFLYLYGRYQAETLFLVWGTKQDLSKRKLKKIWDIIHSTEIPVFPVTGKDLIAKGLTTGPDIGKAMRQLEEKWIKSGFILGKADLLKH